jgi:hypothetical protein
MLRTCLERRPKTSQALALLGFVQLLVDERDAVAEADLDRYIDAEHSDSETAEIVATLALWFLSHRSAPVPEQQEGELGAELAA